MNSKGYSHGPEKWVEFVERYSVELQKKKEHAVVTLLYASKDVEYNNAQVLVKLITNN
jgi:uncharacterized protein YeaO (DUF488 family)